MSSMYAFLRTFGSRGSTMIDVDGLTKIYARSRVSGSKSLASPILLAQTNKDATD